MAYRSNSRFHSVWRKARPPASFPGDGPNGAHVFAIWRANPAFENNRSTSGHKSIEGDFPRERCVSVLAGRAVYRKRLAWHRVRARARLALAA